LTNAGPSSRRKKTKRMKFFDVNDTAIKGLAESAFSGDDRVNWLKMNAPGDYILRILPPWSAEGTPGRKLLSHSEPYGRSLVLRFTTDEGEKKELNVAPLCLDYIFNNDNIKSICFERGWLTEKDEKLFRVYGCPLDILPRQLKKSGEYDKKVHAGYWGRTQVLFNVLLVSGPEANDEPVGKIYKWSISKTRYEDMEGYMSRTNIFLPNSNKDVLVTAKGPKDKTRRYKPPQFVDGEQLNVLTKDIEELPNLDDDMGKGVRNFETLVELVKTNRMDWPDKMKLGDLAKFIKTGR
jgi:hypothetical protein